MKPERLETLLWEQIDGVIGDADRAELEAFLTEHHEARELDQELRSLADGLANIVELDPPMELRPMASVPPWAVTISLTTANPIPWP